jgi:SAM-dependent methyltransferase
VTDLFGHVAPATEPPDGEKGREERDAWFTPELLALAICRSLRDEVRRAPGHILEPGCGGGAFLRAAEAAWPKAKLTGIDLVPACDRPGRIIQGDIFEPRHLFGDWPLIVGNPPYSCAERFVRHCISLLAPGGYLAFLLRAAFLGSGSRVPFYREHPLRYLQPIAPRPTFNNAAGSDPTEYAVFVWQAGHRGRGEILSPLVWR